MASKRNQSAGKGRIVTPAPKSAKGKSTKIPTKASIIAHLATARNVNRSRGAKAHFTDKGAERLATAIAKAHTFPTMTAEGVTVDKGTTSAEARRKFAKAHKATAVAVADILGKGKDGEITHDRPENTIRARLASIAKAMGLPADTYYAIRTTMYAEGEVPKVYIVRR